jgi:hypothetical protein
MKIFASLAMSLVLGMAVACSQMDPNRTSSSNPNAVHTAVRGPLQVPANIGTQNVRGTHLP